MTTVNIQGLDKVELLHALWSNQKSASFFTMSGIPSPQFDHQEANTAVLERIDYFCGRAIKCDLSKNEVDPGLYDRDAGQGTFEKIVNQLRSH